MPAITTISTTAQPSPVPIACVRCGAKSPFPVCEHCQKPHGWSMAKQRRKDMDNRIAVLEAVHGLMREAGGGS